MSAIILLLVKCLYTTIPSLPKIFGMVAATDEFVFSWYALRPHRDKDALCGQFIEALVGQCGSPEIVIVAEDEVGIAKVDGVDVARQNFAGV